LSSSAFYRVIENLEPAASFEAQAEYGRTTPIVYVPREVINQWEDWVVTDRRHDADPPGVYTPDEVQALGAFHAVREAAADALPDNYPSLAEAQALSEWEQLRQSAQSALQVFARRGRMSEDQEVGR